MGSGGGYDTHYHTNQRNEWQIQRGLGTALRRESIDIGIGSGNGFVDEPPNNTQTPLLTVIIDCKPLLLRYNTLWI